MGKEVLLQDDRAARFFTEAYPIGNGSLGAMVYGNWPNERISLNEETLWSGPGRPDKESNSPEDFQQVRDYINKREFGKASELVETKLEGHFGESYLPMGHLELTLPGQKEGEVKRSLRLDQAIVVSEYISGDLHLKSEHFISRPGESFLTRITVNKKTLLGVKISTPLKVISRTLNSDRYTLNGQCPESLVPSYCLAEGEELFYSEKGIAFSASVSILKTDGIISSKEDSLDVSGFTELILAFSCISNFSAFNKEREERTQLPKQIEAVFKHLKGKDWDILRTDHIRDFSAIYSRQELILSASATIKSPKKMTRQRIEDASLLTAFDPGLVELYFNFGKYLLISSSRGFGQAANLQGLWNEELRAPWCSNYTLNINAQMNYWMTEACGISECFGPLLRLTEELYQAGIHSAEKLFHADGWACCHNTDLWRKTEPVEESPSWAFWPWGGVWLSLHLFDHYDYTRSPEILKRIYPIIAGAVRFCCSWFRKDETGIYHTSPSTSPENLFIGPDGKEASVGRSSAMDISMARELITNFLELEKLVGKEPELVVRVSEFLENLAPYRIDSKGRLQEWFDPYKEVEPGHRHMSPLFSVFPGRLFFNDDSVLKEAAYSLFKRRLDNDYDHTGWGAAWVIALASRFTDKKIADFALKTLIGSSSCYNLMNSHSRISDYDKPHLFQIDGNLGGSAAILEMIVSDRGRGELHLFGGLPDFLNCGELRGFHGRGGWLMDLDWEKDEFSLKISSSRSQTLSLSGVVLDQAESGNFCSTEIVLEPGKLFTASGKINSRD